MSAPASFLQRVVTTVGPVGGAASGAAADQALRSAGPLALGRFLRRRWLPTLRRAIAVARAAEDEDLEGQKTEEPTSSAPESVQTVRRAPVLRRSESASADELAPPAASVPEPNRAAAVARQARAESLARPVARRAPGNLPASAVVPVAAPPTAAEATESGRLPAHQAPQPGVLPAPVQPAPEEWSSAPGIERIEVHPETTSSLAVAQLASAALTTVARRVAEITSAGPAQTAAPAHAGAPSFIPATRGEIPAEPDAILVAPGEGDGTESAPPRRRAAGEPTRAAAPAQHLQHVGPDADPGRALPDAREAILAAEPFVQIGSIEIVIEAAPEPRSQPSAPAAAPDFSSRFYLRGL